MNYIDIILITVFIILCIVTVIKLYKRIEGFAEEMPRELTEFIKTINKLSEQSMKVADALEKTQRQPSVQTISPTAVDTSSSAFLKGAKQISVDEAEREIKKQSEQSSEENSEKITIATKARDNNKLPIFDYATFNEFIAKNPQPTIDEIQPFVKDIKEYQNLLDVIYDLVINEMQKMNDQLNKRKETFISEAFRTICCNVPDDSNSTNTPTFKQLSPIEKDAMLKKLESISAALQTPENIKKMLIIDVAFNKMNEIKIKAEKGKTEDVINEYAPDAKAGGEND